MIIITNLRINSYKAKWIKFCLKVYILRIEIKGEILCGNGGLTLQKLDHVLFPPKISTKISCRRQ